MPCALMASNSAAQQSCTWDSACKHYGRPESRLGSGVKQPEKRHTEKRHTWAGVAALADSIDESAHALVVNMALAGAVDGRLLAVQV